MARYLPSSFSDSVLGFHPFSGNHITSFIWWAIRTHIFHVHNRHDALAEQPCILDEGQKTFATVIQQSYMNLKNLVAIYFGMSCVAFRTVSPTSGRSRSNSQMQTLVPSSFCGKLMDYSWRKQVQRVHLCSWLTPQDKRAVQREQTILLWCPMWSTSQLYACSAIDNTNMRSTWLYTTPSQALLPFWHSAVAVCSMTDLK